MVQPMVLHSNAAIVAVPCEYMLASSPKIPQEGPAISFLNCLAGDGFFNGTCFIEESLAMFDFQMVTLSRFPGVLEEESERSLVTDLLLRFLRNVFVHDFAIQGEKWFHNRASNETAISTMINTLELLGKYSNRNVVDRRACKIGNKLTGGNRRDLVKFVAKRLSCTCLKELHRAAREKVAKMGVCLGCQKQCPRSQLFVCTGCMIAEYCSNMCQKADWSLHKRQCGHPEVMLPDLPADYVLR